MIAIELAYNYGQTLQNLCFEDVTGDAGRHPGNLGCILSLQAYFR
jgi:hypothetical protein